MGNLAQPQRRQLKTTRKGRSNSLGMFSQATQTVVLCAVLVFGATARGQAAELSWAKDLKSVLTARCFDCHDTKTRAGGLDLASLGADLTDAATFTTWVKVHDRVRDGGLPPCSRTKHENRA